MHIRCGAMWCLALKRLPPDGHFEMNRAAAPCLIAQAAIFLIASAAWAQGSADPRTGAQRNVDALQSAFGTHAAQRRAHPKGICATGSFVGDVAVQRLTRAHAFFSGQALPATVRFSVGGGDPRASDTIPGVRGMAVHISATGPSAQPQHWLMAGINLPVFSVAQPEFFAGLTAARAQGRDALAAWVQAHPQAGAQAQIDAIARNGVPASYATIPYFGVHTFWLVNAQGQRQPMRWQWMPQSVPPQIQAAPHQPDFLAARLRDRLAQGPVRFELWLMHPQASDDLLNPTIAWPWDRPHTTAGVLTLQAIDDDPRSPCARLSFNPLVLPDGIEPSADPVLQSRAAAYGVSLMRRTSEHLGLVPR